MTTISTQDNNNATTTATTDRLVNLSTGVHGAAIAAVRVVVSFLFVCHGAQGLGAFGGIDGQGTGVVFGAWPEWWATMIALVGGSLVALGLFTRPAALLCSGAMAYAYFVVHQPMALLPLQNLGEQAALFSWIFLLIAVLGSGSFALDSLVRRSRSTRSA
ncbi:putative oxidoreductase [Amycolatopsis marina]|uniref:Putative oxidoreductase n=1 Tax=Amycolatopsis marina TaxID=490629 RepID=A0A1I0Y5H5_9PSEU|nr:DoxX family protein [Amycolatopsis marina]SFB08539.1 putative oxidoreductase [Amycolatopsis marina]